MLHASSCHRFFDAPTFQVLNPSIVNSSSFSGGVGAEAATNPNMPGRTSRLSASLLGRQGNSACPLSSLRLGGRESLKAYGSRPDGSLTFQVSQPSGCI